MAGASDSNSVGSWPALIDQLNNTFNLIRDVFGYALPGAAFLAIGLFYGRFNLYQIQNLLKPYQMPTWMAFIAIVALCYPVGSVMAATAYMPFMLLKYVVWMKYRHPTWWLWSWYPGQPQVDNPPPAAMPNPEEYEVSEEYERSLLYEHYKHRARTRPLPGNKSAPEPPDSTEGTWRAWLLNHPTEVARKIVEIRSSQPKLLDTLDRRETLELLAGSMTIALLGGWYVFYKAQWDLHKIIACAGLITLIQFLTGMPHLRRVAEATKDYYAATKAAPKKEPDFADALADLIKAAQAAAAVLGKTNGS